jgi:hypothetical protein
MTALEALKGANLTTVVASVYEEGSLADKGIVTGKVFDCMALGRPTMVVAPHGSDLYAIAEKAGGMRCFTGRHIAGMSDFFLEVANGNVPQYINRSFFQWGTIARDFDAVLRSSMISQE